MSHSALSVCFWNFHLNRSGSLLLEIVRNSIRRTRYCRRVSLKLHLEVEGGYCWPICHNTFFLWLQCNRTQTDPILVCVSNCLSINCVRVCMYSNLFVWLCFCRNWITMSLIPMSKSSNPIQISRVYLCVAWRNTHQNNNSALKTNKPHNPRTWSFRFGEEAN